MVMIGAVLVAACGGDDGGQVAIDAMAIDAAPEVDAAACPAEPCDILEQCGCEDVPDRPVCDIRATNSSAPPSAAAGDRRL